MKLPAGRAGFPNKEQFDYSALLAPVYKAGIAGVHPVISSPLFSSATRLSS